MANSKSNLVARMAPSTTKPKAASKAPSGMAAFAANMQAHPDVKEATAIMAEQAEHDWDAQYGWEIEQLNRKLPGLDEQFKSAEALVKRNKKLLDDTPPHIKAAADEDGENTKKDFSEWALKDKAMVIVTAIALVAALAMGWSNVYSNLMASGVAIFIDTPLLAMAVSLLLPIASVAIKNMTGFIQNQHYKTTYGFAIYGVTLVLLLAWAVLFALNYNGVGGGLDMDSLLEGDGGTGSMLVWAQLSLELFMGSALFLTIDEIASKYAPDHYAVNMAHVEAKKAYEAALASFEKIESDYAGKHGRLVQLYAEQQRYINEQVASFVAQHSRRAAQFD